MQENQFLLFLNHLRLPYSIPKSFALLLAFHMARHTFATWALSNGVDIATVKDMLAHSSIEMTINYAKVLDKQVVNGFQMLKRKSAFAYKHQ